LFKTLDLPEASDSPWNEERQPQPNADEDAVFDYFRELNFDNFLGYGRATTGDDPTPSRDSRHLIILTNSLGCRLHLQIHQNDLAAQDFNKVTLNWVDFD